jgi:hypothetical protein
MLSGDRLLVACRPRLYSISLPPFKTPGRSWKAIEATVIETLDIAPRGYIPAFAVHRFMKMSHNGQEHLPQKVAIWSAGHIHLISASTLHEAGKPIIDHSLKKCTISSGLGRGRSVNKMQGEFASGNTFGMVKWRNGGGETFVLLPAVSHASGMRLERRPSEAFMTLNGDITFNLSKREWVFHMEVDEESGFVFALTGQALRLGGTFDMWRMCICTLI